MTPKNQNCTILVTGCKKYKDVLGHFEYFFKKHWPDCPYPIILSTDDEAYETDFAYDEIVYDPHRGNMARFRAVTIETPYVIMIQDDHWLISDVDTEAIERHIELAKKYNAGNLRLAPEPATCHPFDEANQLLQYHVGQAYRISARAGLWATDYFMEFVQRYDDFWVLERQGQALAETIDRPVLHTKYRVLPMVDTVHKGYYEDFAVALLEAHGRDASPRTIAPRRILLREVLKGAILEINPDLITKIQGKLDIGYKMK